MDTFNNSPVAPSAPLIKTVPGFTPPIVEPKGNTIVPPCELIGTPSIKIVFFETYKLAHCLKVVPKEYNKLSLGIMLPAISMSPEIFTFPVMPSDPVMPTEPSNVTSPTKLFTGTPLIELTLRLPAYPSGPISVTVGPVAPIHPTYKLDPSMTVLCVFAAFVQTIISLT